MRYIGGKKRQSKQIVQQLKDRYKDDFKNRTYVEPFCGAMWSATAVMKAFPYWKYVLSDVNPYLMCFWKATKDGWNPPEKVTEDDYKSYNKRRPIDDPMTGYVGFAWSFSGKFFGGAARTNKIIKGSYLSCTDKIKTLRNCDVTLNCHDFSKVRVTNGAVVYLDPPYEGRTPQRKENQFNKESYVKFTHSLVSKCDLVLATEFNNEHGWELLHDYGDTVVRHLNAKPRDGTRELLMRVTV